MNLLEPDGRFWGLCHPVARGRPERPAEGEPGVRPVPPGGRAGPGAGLAGEVAARRSWPSGGPRSGRRRSPAATGWCRSPRTSVPIRPEWVRLWTDDAAARRVRAGGAGGRPGGVGEGGRPDASALVVAGPASPGRTRCGAWRRRRGGWRPRSWWQLIDDADRRWRPDVILFESNAAFAGIRDLLVRHARFGPKVQGRDAEPQDKAARVAAFSVAVENGSVPAEGATGGRGGPGAAGAVRRDDDVPVRRARRPARRGRDRDGVPARPAPEPRVWVPWMSTRRTGRRPCRRSPG